MTNGEGKGHKKHRGDENGNIVDKIKKVSDLGDEALKNILVHDIALTLSQERRQKSTRDTNAEEQHVEQNKIMNKGSEFRENFLYTSFEASEVAILREVLKTGPSDATLVALIDLIKTMRASKVS